jgi:hypothetical protein
MQITLVRQRKKQTNKNKQTKKTTRLNNKLGTLNNKNHGGHFDIK